MCSFRCCCKGRSLVVGEDVGSGWSEDGGVVGAERVLMQVAECFLRGLVKAAKSRPVPGAGGRRTLQHSAHCPLPAQERRSQHQPRQSGLASGCRSLSGQGDVWAFHSSTSDSSKLRQSPLWPSCSSHRALKRQAAHRVSNRRGDVHQRR